MTERPCVEEEILSNLDSLIHEMKQYNDCKAWVERLKEMRESVVEGADQWVRTISGEKAIRDSNRRQLDDALETAEKWEKDYSVLVNQHQTACDGFKILVSDPRGTMYETPNFPQSE